MQSSQGSGSGRPATISFPELSARPRRPPSSPAWPGRLHSLPAQLVCPPCRGSGSVSDVCSDPGVSQRRFLRFPAAAPSARGLAAAVRQAVLGLTVLGLLHVTSVPGGGSGALSSDRPSPGRPSELPLSRHPPPGVDSLSSAGAGAEGDMPLPRQPPRDTRTARRRAAPSPGAGRGEDAGGRPLQRRPLPALGPELPESEPRALGPSAQQLPSRRAGGGGRASRLRHTALRKFQ